LKSFEIYEQLEYDEISLIFVITDLHSFSPI